VHRLWGQAEVRVVCCKSSLYSTLLAKADNAIQTLEIKPIITIAIIIMR
jgi:hypothetical protein